MSFISDDETFEDQIGEAEKTPQPDLSLPTLATQPLRARAACGALLLILGAMAVLMILYSLIFN